MTILIFILSLKIDHIITRRISEYLFSATATALGRRAPQLDAANWRAVRWQLLLSAGYVLGCAWRSALPVFDIERQVMVDSWLSSVAVGRSVATVAELCFAAQWALLLQRAAAVVGSAAAARAARVLLPMIVLAELCSWHAVLTTSNLGHVVEESLWGLAALVVVGAALAMRRHCAPALKPLLTAWAVAAAVYAAYMAAVDVPMYAARWLADAAAGRSYLSLDRGLADAAGRWVVRHHWEAWRSEVVWMSLYFSVAVWFSIGLAHAAAHTPALRPAPRA